MVGKIQATGGIQQGSKDAPLFWNLTMYLILQDLLAQYDHAWILEHLVVYADDFHMRWIVQSPADGLRAMHDLSFLMRVFGAYGLKINPTKSFAMLRLVGKALPSFQKRWINRTANGPMLRLPDMAITVPLVVQSIGSRYDQTQTHRCPNLLSHSAEVAPRQASSIADTDQTIPSMRSTYGPPWSV